MPCADPLTTSADFAQVDGRPWEAVAPGRHLVAQDYDLRGADVVPATESAEELLRIVAAAWKGRERA